MKRFLAFIALFAVGLAVLLWIQSRGERADAPSAPPEQAPSAPEPGQLTEVSDSKGQTGEINVSGPLDSRFKPPETGRLRWHVTASDIRLIGEGVFDLPDFQVRFYNDRGDGELESEATAARARGKLDTTQFDVKPFDESAPITLFDARATLHRGIDFSPLTLTVPELTGVFATRTFNSADQVEVAGRGLVASGRGLEVDGVAGSLRLLDNPNATVELEGGGSVRLKSRGAFSILSRPDLGPKTLEISSRDAAELVFDGPRKLSVRADVVRLFGEIESGATERFVPSRAEAEGHVVLEPSEGVFSGERGTLEFENGEPSHAALDGEPKLDLVLRGAALERVPAELLVEGETLTVQMRGAGPLELFIDAGERFVFTGPATLELPAVAAKLAATRSIEGALGPDRHFEELAAFGSATFDYEGVHVDAEDFLVRAFVDERERAAVRLVGVGPTHIDGLLPDGRPFDLLARAGLVAERRADGLRVPSADDVDLRVEGADGFFASADHVRDVDLTALTLTGEGDIEFESERGRGRGTRLDVLGPARGELSGSEQQPARFELEQGSFEARYISFDGTRIQARVDAHALAQIGTSALDVNARWVAIERRVLDPDPAAIVEGGESDRAEPGLQLLAGGDVHATVTGATERWLLECDELRAFADEARDARDRAVIDPTGLVARGSVNFDYESGAARLSGAGERLVVSRERRGQLFPAPGGKVQLDGDMPGSEIEFVMLADDVEFAPTSLSASGFDVTVDGLELPWHSADAPAEQRFVRAIGARMSVDDGALLFTDTYLGGPTQAQGDWSFDAPFILLTGSVQEAQAGAKATALRDLLAWGGFDARLGRLGGADGETIQILNARKSATISGNPAHITRPEIAWQSTWFDVDLATGYLRSDAGEVGSDGSAGNLPWTLRYASIEPVVTPDETIQVLREPVLTQGTSEFRAAWAIAWLDRGEWLALSGALASGTEPPKPVLQRKPDSLFDHAGFGEISRWLREVYLEGEIEYRVQGERRARADSAYFDLVQGNGWLRKIDLTLEVPFSKRDDRMKVQADSLRHSLDGSLEATNAVVTSCSFDEPHYVIRIGDFSMLPRWKEETQPPKNPGEPPRVIKKHDGWDFELENNVIASPGGFEIPMPRVDLPTNRDFEIDPDALRVANFTLPSFGKDSKMGTFVSTRFTRDLGWVAHRFHFFLNWVFRTSFGLPDLPKINGRTTTSASYFGSRGGSVGSESVLESPGRYRFDVLLDLIYDRGKDRGLLRVPEDDRSEFREWFRVRGRYLLGPTEWLDAVLTWQSDPGVQAEFFERDYLEYEERETYLHYRRAEGESQWHATLETRLDDFRTEVVEQPSLGYFRGRSKVGSLAGNELIYTSNTTIEQLARSEGELPYELPFADGLGERDVTRVDTLQRLDSPLTLGYGGLRATPFVSARATGWSDNALENDPAGRALLFAGAELSTTFWKLFASGSRHSWTPSVGYRADVASSDTHLPVAQFDEVDAAMEGQYLDLALRSRWEYRELKSDLDLELRETYANDVPSGQVEGWEPIWVRGSWLSRFLGMPFGATHDGRYDLEATETDFSRTFIGWEPRPDLELEAGHHTARDLAGAELYEALSVGARYALSAKWEVEGDYTFSIGKSGERLGSSLLLRRIGHDFVFEVESSFVAGEGASSLKFNLTPVLTWKSDDRSMLDRWRATRD